MVYVDAVITDIVHDGCDRINPATGTDSIGHTLVTIDDGTDNTIIADDVNASVKLIRIL